MIAFQNTFPSEALVRCDLFEKACDNTYWSNFHPYANTHFKAGDIVFCKTDEVLRLFEYLRLTRKRIVLVTGESDVPCDFFRQQFLPLNVERWFASNVTHPHPKVTALPLGLGGVEDPVTLNIDSQKFDISRDQWLYINFRPETNPAVRQRIYDSFKVRAQQEHWITCDLPSNHGGNKEFLTQLKRHRFVLAPPGNGIDTHRLWEALALGSYPIALRSSVLEPFEALPILLVEHYDEVTLDFLKKNLLELQTKQQNLFVLQMDFWVQKINGIKLSLRGKEKLTWSKWVSASFFYGLSMTKRRVLKKA
ncbi:MAG: exostosin family protein [Verrucomicrobia bacterium]|nr:MAG: exostosin family protein [Verrucomicrobiota bacterium]